MRERQLLEHVLRGGDDARLAGLLRRLQVQLLEQHVGELFRRVDVELARRRGRRSARTDRRARSASSRPSPASAVDVDLDAGALDVGEHRNQRLFELAIDAARGRPARGRPPGPGASVERQVGALARERRRATSAGTASSVTAFTPLPVDVLFGQRAVARALEREAVDRVARSRRVDQIARDHRVEIGAARASTPSRAQRDRRELQVVTDLLDRRIREHRTEPREHLAARKIRRIGEARVRDRDVPRRARRRRERPADDIGADGRLAAGDRRDADAAGRAQRGGQRVDFVERSRRPRSRAARSRPSARTRRRACGNRATRTARSTRSRVGPAIPQRVGIERHGHVGADARQLAARARVDSACATSASR